MALGIPLGVAGAVGLGLAGRAAYRFAKPTKSSMASYFQGLLPGADKLVGTPLEPLTHLGGRTRFTDGNVELFKTKRLLKGRDQWFANVRVKNTDHRGREGVVWVTQKRTGMHTKKRLKEFATEARAFVRKHYPELTL